MKFIDRYNYIELVNAWENYKYGLRIANPESGKVQRTESLRRVRQIKEQEQWLQFSHAARYGATSTEA